MSDIPIGIEELFREAEIAIVSRNETFISAVLKLSSCKMVMTEDKRRAGANLAPRWLMIDHHSPGKEKQQ